MFSAQSFKIIIFSIMFIFTNELYTYFFISINKHRWINKILLFSVVIYFIINMLLVTNLNKGFLGASWALLCIQIFVSILYSVAFLKLLRMKEIQ